MLFLCVQPRAISQMQEHCLEQCWIQGCLNSINQIKHERRPLGCYKNLHYNENKLHGTGKVTTNKDLILHPLFQISHKAPHKETEAPPGGEKLGQF